MSTPAPASVEIGRIADLLRRAHQGDAWHGPSLTEALDGVTAAKAAARPLAAAHSIWEIVLHVAAWEEIVRLTVTHGKVGDVTDERDWPPVKDTSEAAWANARAGLDRSLERLEQALTEMVDANLERKTSRGTSWYRLLHGLVHHALYHAGQISLLKKG
jgi:uncharacterized damage-inducible protein DinB